MSQGPETAGEGEERDDYLSAYNELAQRVRDGASFSGRERHCAFLNTGGTYFADISAISAFGLPQDGRGMALTDWDHDGDLDIWLSNRTAPRMQFLLNRIPNERTRWVAVRLEGDPAQRCPRDAIGSKVEVVLSGGGGRRVKTLHAGNGLMSQSTKWLHFGLGTNGAIAEVRVRWAGGREEVFAGLEAGKRWLLKQGSKVAAELAARKPPRLEAMPLDLPPPTDVARIRISQPLKTPELVYEDLSGKERKIAEISDRRAVLVNLWATWCPPCVEELAAFADARARFEDADLDVLALNVDHLGPEAEASAERAADFLRKHGYSGSSGMARADLVDLLDDAILKTVYRHHSMPVPVSFLIDKGGWLSAIYKGPVSVEEVLADRRELGKGPEQAKAAALPFEGIWADPHLVRNPLTVARAYIEGGYLDDARAEMERFLEDNDVPPGNPSVPAAHQRNMQFASIHFHLGEVDLMEGKQRAARAAYEASLRYNPKQLPALNNLAWLLATSPRPDVRDGAAAVKHAEFMMQAPGIANNPSLLGTLAAAYAAAGRFADAAETTRKVVALLEERGSEAEAAVHRDRLGRYQRNEALSLEGERG